ncbi:pseudouridine synthase [Loigolactobacillus binensis]|uniref:Pseudouridine synthase n=1 Tax=Loigolactobacillus binensis TaxID=2559922 RepID=A0ABW3ECC6_9LACO|nr:pseudouridine synthase [Loigolactobacillus binensis]
MRLDKFLVHAGIGSRKEVQQLIRSKQVQVNTVVVSSNRTDITPLTDQVRVAGELVHYQQFYYYMLNKPVNVLSATTDAQQRTVLDLLATGDARTDLFPVGRLDKDTTGLLLLTNDGQLAHQLLSPRRQVAKVYRALIAGVVTAADQRRFAAGITTKAGNTFAPAALRILATDTAQQQSDIEVTVYEGKFHEVKRLFQAVGKEVLTLQRIQMGGLQLDATLAAGAYRPLTMAEIALLRKTVS